jgi:hypothetical protein
MASMLPAGDPERCMPPVLKHHSKAFQDALNQLAVLMRPHPGAAAADDAPKRRGIVFLLGAGCSMQYGLPGFQPLLGRVYRRLYGKAPAASDSLPELRDRLDFVFANQDLEAIAALKRQLGNVDGADCLGYRLLAEMMREGLVDATVTMNFDTLLDDACRAERYADPTLYRIHGSIKGSQKPILNIEHTEFFSVDSSPPKPHLIELLTINHVVTIGYSGVDAKMREVLSIPVAAVPPEERPPLLFFVGLTPPDVRFASAILARKSGAFTITGSEGTFENFMQGLAATLAYRAGREPLRPEPAALFGQGDHGNLTTLESVALKKCLRLALRIRTAMNVADASETGIEQHGDAVFSWCLRLADGIRLPLTSPERYLLYCAAYLHDLGYFRAYSGGGRIRWHPGWELLRNHGRFTAELLREYLLKRAVDDATLPTIVDLTEAATGIVPGSYGPDAAGPLVWMLIELCRWHTGFSDEPPDSRRPEIPSGLVVGGRKIKVRFDLLRAVLTAAEEISRGHPFLPSGDPIDPGATPPFVIDDPVLDIYLRRSQQPIDFALERDTVTAIPAAVVPAPPEELAVEAWLVYLGRSVTNALSETALAKGGDPLRFVAKPGHERAAAVSDLLDDCLADRLTSHLKDLGQWEPKDESLAPGTALRILDLYTIYALHAYTSAASHMEAGDGAHPPDAAAVEPAGHEANTRRDRREPKARRDSPAVGKAIERFEACRDDKREGAPHEGLVSYYLRVEPEAAELDLDRAFDSFMRRIYLPGWRFCAQNWWRGNSQLVMACASLDLGSTLHRSEVTYGLRSLPLIPRMGTTRQLGGHNGCTLCTGRLLYVLAYACLFRHDFQVGEQRGLYPTDAARQIVDYLLARERDPRVWWGIEDAFEGAFGAEHQRLQTDDGHVGNATTDREIQAGDYIAAAVRGIAFFLWTDSRVRVHDGKGILEPKARGKLDDLLAWLWELICTAPPQRLLSQQSEEPHSYVLGEIARTYLTVRRLRPLPDGSALPLDERLFDRGRENLRVAVGLLQDGGPPAAARSTAITTNLSQLSQFYLLPAHALLHDAAPHPSQQREELLEQMVGAYQRCVESRIWILKGNDAGSWGYNQENTARLLLVNCAFWRHAFENRREFENRPEFREVEP